MLQPSTDPSTCPTMPTCSGSSCAAHARSWLYSQRLCFLRPPWPPSTGAAPQRPPGLPASSRRRCALAMWFQVKPQVLLHGGSVSVVQSPCILKEVTHARAASKCPFIMAVLMLSKDPIARLALLQNGTLITGVHLQEGILAPFDSGTAPADCQTSSTSIIRRHDRTPSTFAFDASDCAEI